MARKKRSNITDTVTLSASDSKPIPPCPVHKLVGKQSFSVEEMEWHLAHKEENCICKDCAYFFEKEINRSINREILF